ncbi:olfactory receptor 5T7-like [Ascaphus truei]|uniref:olfactory receptor 5T7-like n=1 Tax=Ascaphus truei TaxID=8439 RepID=UPI003F59B072
MNGGNRTTGVSEFVLLGFTDPEELKMPLFLLFSTVYALTVLGNIGMAVIIWTTPRFHIAMYIFLFNLSLVDVCFATTISPMMLANLLRETASISLMGCSSQMCFAVAFGSSECFLLAFMAYDRYVAVCSPLHYTMVMNKRRCLQLVVTSHLSGFLHSIIHTVFTFRSPFCRADIHHFFCDIQPLLKLSCKETFTSEILLFTFTGSITTCCLLAIVVSYVFILEAILKIRSSGGRSRTFSTCSSHLVSVSLFYGCVLFMYLRPNSSYQDQDLSASVFYSLVIPMLNPFIYSLRNRDVKMVLRKTLFVKKLCSST